MQQLRVKFLEHDDLSNLHLEVVWPKLQKPAALIEEARLTAREYMRSETKLVRGGPWCREKLPTDDLNEIEWVAACTSRAEVQNLARKYPSGSLAYHLAGKSYSEPCEEASAGSSPITLPGVNAKGPLIILRPKRASGKHKPGMKRPSGTHRPGTKRFSTKYAPGIRRRSGKHKPGIKRPSGSQSSGSHRRFNALPLKRPASRGRC